MSDRTVVEAGPGAKPRANGRGILIAVMAFAVFSGTDALVKVLAIGVSAPQVTFMVTLIALVALVAYAAATGQLRLLLPRHPGLAFLRALFLAADTILIHYAFSVLPLADAYLLAFLTPLLVALMGFVLLGERLSALAWVGVVFGFAGVAVALKPGLVVLNLGHLAALASAVFFALSLILLRRTKAQESDMALIASLLVVLTPVALAVAMTTGKVVPIDLAQTGLVVLAGLLLLGGHALLVRAFRVGEASVVSASQYSQIIWGCIYGFVLFAAPIELHTLLGAAMIAVSGWLVLQ